MIPPPSGPSRLLLIDDDREFAALLREYLSPMGYALEAAHDGVEGAGRATSETWQAIILDVMLPGLDGFEVLKRIRKESDVPVLMLTSRGDEMDRIVGLEVGADDYVPKTFSMRELLARLRAVTRRAMNRATASATGTASDAGEPEVVAGPVRLNPNTRTALLDDQLLLLTPVEFDLLLSLTKARGRVRTREQLLDEIRDREWEAFDRSIDVHIAALRKKLGDDAKDPRFIRTLRSAGYMWVG